ncbi:MAG: hypothetical protein OHK0013_03110 [Sandaracinaceae bacterium]
MSDLDEISPPELEQALPVVPVDASLRMKVQRAARAHYEGEHVSAFVWHEALVPATLILAGVLYGIGALQQLAQIFS